jgi:CRISPR/Cas system-associated protein Csm6
VDQPDLAIATRVSGVEVLGDDRWNVARREGMEIERVLDRNTKRLGLGSQIRAGCRS